MNIKKIFLVVIMTLFYATSQAQDNNSDTIKTKVLENKRTTAFGQYSRT